MLKLKIICNIFSKRFLYSNTCIWIDKLSPEIRKDLEFHWKNKINSTNQNSDKEHLHNISKKQQNVAKEKYYVLSMFPYPSGQLHMGHVRVYTISDAMARYHKIKGKDVIHPMGWDAFGLPAENAAFERRLEPDKWTESNIVMMKKQLMDLGCDFDWCRELKTSDPDYYKWTQFIFLKLYEAGLIYRKLAAVNWDPVDETVLADEQIDSEGRSWRSGVVVQKKMLKQWYIKTTAYSKSLLEGLDTVDSDLWRDVVSLQRNWIGPCDLYAFNFPLIEISEEKDEKGKGRQTISEFNYLSDKQTKENISKNLSGVTTAATEFLGKDNDGGREKKFNDNNNNNCFSDANNNNYFSDNNINCFSNANNNNYFSDDNNNNNCFSDANNNNTNKKKDNLKSDYLLGAKDSFNNMDDYLSVCLNRPEAMFGITHILLSKDHVLNDPKYYKEKEKREQKNSSMPIKLKLGVFNPITMRTIPLYIVDSLITSSDTGLASTPAKNKWISLNQPDHRVGIPSLNEDDYSFALQHRLTINKILNEKDQSEKICNSGKFSGMNYGEASEAIINKAKEFNCGGHMTSRKARDWLISRQRYWGTPIPIVHCPKYGPVPVSLAELPVRLPKISQLKGHGVSPLTTADDWLKAKCSRCDCDGYGRREADTMDTFVDSSWYFLRYLDPTNSKEPFSYESTERTMPVDLYIGGKEHAILHLYYARFFSHFLYDQGLIAHKEPFKNLLTQGMVLGQSYRLPTNTKGQSLNEVSMGRYLKSDEVEIRGNKAYEKSSNLPVISQWEKMSKSKYNGIDPQDLLEKYGSEATRLAILSNVAPKSPRPWSNDVFVGVLRWQSRIWNLVSRYRSQIKNIENNQDNNNSNNKSNNNNTKSVENKDEIKSKKYDINNGNKINRISNGNDNISIDNMIISNGNDNISNDKMIILAENDDVSDEEQLGEELRNLRNYTVLQVTHHFEKTFLFNTAISRLQMLTNMLGKIPDRMIAKNTEYSRSVVDLITMLSPITPFFASELMSGMTFNKSFNFSELKWPQVDADFRLPMSIKINSKDAFELRLPMTYDKTTSELTEDVAWKLIQSISQFATLLQNVQIENKSLNFTDGVKVEFNISIKSSASSKRLLRTKKKVIS